jgi:phenylalanyl-tRNA synthetase beta chain
MKVLLSILTEMADIPRDVDQVATALNSLGLPVEQMQVVGQPVAGVITAKIVRTEKHPDAAKVTRCFVDAGDGEVRHVWCGATNMKDGDIVALATLGTTMPSGMEIARRGILGIDSEGMLCSESELGLAEESDGIVILPATTPLGVGVFEALGIEHDVVLELDLTRNRADCWGHLGVARDLAAYFNVPLHGPRREPGALGAAKEIPVAIKDEEHCGSFTISYVSGVQVGSSPQWVSSRLAHLGMRSINNVVDASNLVMWETNQPNHAYDADVVSSFVVRLARDGEVMTTLDGAERSLNVADLLICDGKDDSAVGLAGVMGDLHSEITDATVNLAIESAWFNPDSVRFAAQRHGLRSEASVRFERGTDPEGWVMAAERFVTILRETCPDIVLHASAAVVRNGHCPQVREVKVSAQQVEKLLGVHVPVEKMLSILDSIGFKPARDGDVITASVPTWRPDCSETVDLIEEIARHFGYDNIGKTVPHSTVHGRLSTMQQRRRIVRQVLVGLGLDEAMPSPFLAPGDLVAVGLHEDDVLRIANPLVADESILRTSLRPGLLRSLKYNQSHRASRIGLWEIGHIYPSSGQQLPDEREWLTVMVAGGDATNALGQWNALCDALSVGAQLDQARVPAGLHPTRSATLARGKTVVGVVGEIDPFVLDSLGIEGRVSILEVDLTTVLNENPKAVQARDVNRFPSSDIDLAFVLPDDVAATLLQRAIRQAAGKKLVELELFDVYRGAGVPQNHRSLAFRLRLQEPGGTMNESGIAEIQKACIAAAEKIGAQLRS